MTKEQKKKADEITDKIKLVEKRLKDLSEMLHPHFLRGDFIFSQPMSSTGIVIDKRVAIIVHTIIEADYKNELKELEVEFNAL